MKLAIRQLRRRLLFTRNGYFPKVNQLDDVEYFGSEYGGWPLVTRFLTPQSCVLSFGLGSDISFDLAVIHRFRLQVHGFDPTPRSEEWISQQSLPSSFHYYNLGLAGADGELVFQAPSNRNYVSYSSVTNQRSADSCTLPVRRLSTILDEFGFEKVDVLKMDIEGSEVDVVHDLVAGPHRPTQVLVEFHHRIHRTRFDRTKTAIEALEAAGYQLFDVGSLGDEYSFVRKCFLDSGAAAERGPH